MHAKVVVRSPETAAELARVERELDDARVSLSDRASDLRADGVGWSQLAGALGVVLNSVKEKYGVRPRPWEREAFRRRVASYGVEERRPRVTAYRRHVCADLGEPVGPEGPRWRIVRSCANADEAAWLAEYLGTGDGAPARLVKRPKDFAEGQVVGWQLGPIA
jgi:hypothetical protein